MQLPGSFNELVVQANELDLYSKLVFQLNKDFLLANIDLEFSESISPDELKKQLHEVVFNLIQYKFGEYLNLLYIIDVSESQIKQLDGSDTVGLSAQVSFLILRREWQKVWYKHKY
ncbi:hypothetical protein [Mangrovimonas aestuarii]|uniref:hypothetical protein n=1 Tax=Mangrovimonas aestuarii TaxID=3018443 RepID=UPI002379A700|nr:hypothetical protein [Mangrovimonas aestuarii]